MLPPPSPTCDACGAPRVAATACPHCGKPYVNVSAGADVDATIQRPRTMQPPTSGAGIITAVPGPADPVPPGASVPSPGMLPPLPGGGQQPRFVDAEPTASSSKTSPKVIIAIVAVLALLGGGAAFLLGGDDGDGDKSDVAPVTTVAGATDTTPSETAAPSTIDDTTTDAPSTTIETTVAPTTTSPYIGPGASFIVSDPLPSGVTEDRAEDALPFAQLFADRITDNDWVGAASMVPDLPPTTEQLQAAFGSVERFSLIVLDAADDGFGVTLQLAGVTNEADGTTAVRCLRWTVNPEGLSAGGVYDPVIVAVYTEQRTADEVLADPAAMDSIRAQCVLA